MTPKTNILQIFLQILPKFLLIFLCLFSFNNAVFSQNIAKNSTKYDTNITSKLIDIKQKSQTIDFIDNVVIKNGPDIMTSKKVILFYQKLPNSNKNEIKTINAYEDVKIFSADFVATAELGYYNPKESLFILEKDVIVNNGDSIGVGDKFIYSLITKQGEFVTNKKGRIKSKTDHRVSVTIGNKTLQDNKKGNKKDKK